MTRTLSFVLVGLLFATPAFAGKKGKKSQANPIVTEVEVAKTDDRVFLPCQWPTGMSWRYAETTSKRSDAKPEHNRAMAAPLQVSIETGGNPATIRMTWETATVEASDELLKMMGEGDLESPDLVLSLDTGTITQIVNFDEVAKVMRDGSLKAVEGQPAQVAEQVLQMFADPATVQALILKSPGKFFSAHCLAMTPGQSIVSTVMQPNIFGGSAIAFSSSVTLQTYDANAGTVLIVTEDAPKPEALKKMLDEALAKYLPPDVSAEQTRAFIATMPPIKTVMSGRYLMSIEDGFPIEIDVVLNVSSADGPVVATERWTWVRVVE